MKRKVKTQLLVLLIFIIIVAVPQVQAKTWIVDDDGHADFNKIQEAIDAANPGDIIAVQAGTFTENVKVNKNNLEITSDTGPDFTIVKALDPGTSAFGTYPVFEVWTDNVRINNLSVTGAKGFYDFQGRYGMQSAIVIIGNNCIISNNNISFNEIGISNNANNSIIKNNYISNSSGIGIRISGEFSQNGIMHNTIINGGYEFPNNGIGINIIYGLNNTIQDNYIAFNRIDGILLDHSSNNTIFNNTIIENEYVGIRANYICNHNNISNNRIFKNKYGILLVDCDFTILKYNDLFDTFDTAIYLQYFTQSIVSHNNITNSERGIYLYGDSYIPSNNNIISENLIFNQTEGIIINQLCVDNVFTKNVISNSDIGIKFWQGSELFSVNNSIFLNNFIDNNLNVFLGDHYKCHSNWNSTQPIAYFHNGQSFNSRLGNYWNNYISTDTNGDGIADVPYTFDSMNIDFYPLIGSFENYVVTSGPSITTLPAPILQAPGEPTSPGPILSTLTPDFTWDPVSGADKYHIFISDTATGELQTFDVTSSPFTLPSGKLIEGHSYRWNMNSYNPLSTEDIGFGPGWGSPNATRYYFQAPEGNEPAEPVVTESLTLSPGPYYIDDTITARFTIKNIGETTVNFDKLTVGGRYYSIPNIGDGKLPYNGYPDFPYVPMSLLPGGTYTFEKDLKVTIPGYYNFFCAYTPYPKDPSGWNVDIPRGSPEILNSVDIRVLEKVPVILVHGWNGKPSMWDPLINELNENGIESHVFDYSSHTEEDPRHIAEEFKTFVDNEIRDTYQGQFDIICHSEGAVVTRYYMEVLNGGENAKNVRQWIGIAPASHGVALLDLNIDELLDVLFTLLEIKDIIPWKIIINQFIPLFGDVHDQLNTDSDTIHAINDDGIDPNVVYRVIVGYNDNQNKNYGPVPLLSNLIFQGKTVEMEFSSDGTREYYKTYWGDGVVANLQSYIQGASLDSFGGLHHTNIYQNPEVIDKIIGYIQHPQASILENWPQVEADKIIIERIEDLIKNEIIVIKNDIIHNFEKANVPFTVGENFENLLIRLDWPGSDLDLILITPSGQIIHGAGSYVNEYVKSGTTILYSIDNPEPGMWTAQIIGVDVPEDGEQYFLIVNSPDDSLPPNPIPEFPSIFLPTSMIIGFLGAVLLIQRTRQN